MKIYRKQRRAKSKDDFETWIESEEANTLNTFDVGGVRTTTVIVASVDVYNQTVSPDVAIPLRAAQGGDTTPKVLIVNETDIWSSDER